MNIRKYSSYLSFFIMILFLFIVLASQFYHHFVDPLNSRIQYANTSKSKYKYIVLGSSHTKYGVSDSFDPILNLSSKGETFIYSYKVFKKLNRKMTDQTIVIIPVSIFSFVWETKEQYNYRYFSAFKLYDFIGVSTSEYFRNLLFGSLYNNKVLFGYICSMPKSKSLYNKNRLEYPRDLDLDRRIEVALPKVESHLTNLDYKERQDKYIETRKILVSLLSLVKEHNARAILITTPQTYLYNNLVSAADYKERIYDNIAKVRSQLDFKVEYLDYSHYERFEDNLELFSDVDHLNKKGADKFTKILLDDISKLKNNN